MIEIFEEGEFIPSVGLRNGENVMVRGHVFTVAFTTPNWWKDTDGVIHDGGAWTAINVTEDPAAVMSIYLELRTKGVM